MSIDTLLEAARYLEWEAQQQQIAREEDQRKQKELFTREAELRCSEVVTLSAPATGTNHHQHHQLALGGDPRPLQVFHVPVVSPPPPSSPSLPPAAPLPFAVVPVVPVVAPAPSLAPALVAAVAAAPIAVATQMLNGSSPSHPVQQQKPLPALLSSPAVKLEPASHQNGDGAVQSQPSALQAPYQASFSSTPPSGGGVSPHALLPPHSPEMKPNGLMGDDLRGPDGKRRPGGAGTREVHNMLEKNRRAHLKECFETLKKNVPNVDDKKTSNLSVLRGALRYIQTLKRKEKEYEHEMERLARAKIAAQQRLGELKNELSLSMDAAEMERVLRQTVAPEDDQVSTSTASEGEEDLDQDFDDEDVSPPPPPPAAPLPPKAPPPPVLQAHPLLTLQQAALPLPLSGVQPAAPPPPVAIAPAPQAIAPYPLQPSAAAGPPQPTVIAHAAVSHPSVIQAVHHAPPAHLKHLTPIAPSPGPAPAATLQVPVAAVAAPAGAAQRITVHPVAHLGPAHLFPQTVSVTQPTVLGHITRTFTHHHPHHHALAPAHATANGVHVNGGPAVVKPALLAPHPQLVGQATVLNPVTLVNVPVGTLKLT